MLEEIQATQPTSLAALQQGTEALGFSMASDVRVGTLLRTLAASKPGGTFLELGTGTGMATAWILDGMDRNSTLVTVDNDEAVASVARQHLGTDPRATFVLADGGDYLVTLLSEGRSFDFVFADTWPGKYTHLEDALQLVVTGGLYVIDDMLPQSNWPDDHAAKVDALIDKLFSNPGLLVSPLSWSTGVIIATRTGRRTTR